MSLPEGYMAVRRPDAREPSNEPAELIAAIDADRKAGRTLATGDIAALVGTVVRFCLASDSITLSASDAMSLARAALPPKCAKPPCQNCIEVGGGMDGERYRCAVCKHSYYLDYEDMK